MNEKNNAVHTVAEYLTFFNENYSDYYPTSYKHTPSLLMRGEPMLYTNPCSSLWNRQIREIYKGEELEKLIYYISEITVFSDWDQINKEITGTDYDVHQSEQQKISQNWIDLALARHHGAPTRLVDFTQNPLVALWFSCVSNWLQDRPTEQEEDGYVYFVLGKIYSYAFLNSGPFITPHNEKFKYKFVKPPGYEQARKSGSPEFRPDFEDKECFFLNADGTHHNRIKNQGGKFFVSADVNKTIFDYPDIETKKVVIPLDAKKHIERELSRMNIDRSTLGLVTPDNAGDYAKRRAYELLKSGKELGA